MIRLAVLAWFGAALAGCLDSLVDDPCVDGYRLVDGACAPPPTNAGPERGTRGESVEPIEPPVEPTAPEGLSPDVCAPPQRACDGTCVDVATDPAHCGACDVTCASGACTAGVCDAP